MLDIALILLFLLLVYLILTRVFGHSATPIEITLTVFTVLGGLLYKLNREVGEIKIGVSNGFQNVAKDMNEIKNKIRNR